MKNKIVFVGMPSCGKTKIGKRIAKALELDFIDTDNIIKQRAGRDLSEIIKTSGDDALLKFENEALMTNFKTPAVIATGGSAVFCTEGMNKLSKESVIVFLDINISTLKSRVKSLEARGVVMGGKSIEEVYMQRRALYLKYADIIINNDRFNAAQTTVNIINRLVKKGYIRIF